MIHLLLAHAAVAGMLSGTPVLAVLDPCCASPPSEHQSHRRERREELPYRTHEVGRGPAEPMVDLREPEERDRPYYNDTSSCGHNRDCEPGDSDDNHEPE